jgi:8-amino-7-oxononanoate synthase
MDQRKNDNALRSLSSAKLPIDFSSNDYLGFAKSAAIFNAAHNLLLQRGIFQNGATGSRLISGNHELHAETESLIAKFHQSESALIFNSGYDANVGFFSSVPQRSDIILYDELSHASIRDGISLSKSKSYKFGHNDFEDLEALILRCRAERSQGAPNEIYIVTESVFSMDGDAPNLGQLTELSAKYNCLLVIDEAHALGVFGENGNGLVQSQQLQQQFFARIVTFGKGLGCHGAAILGSNALRDYLINFARSFIYTTALPPHSVATIFSAYSELQSTTEIRKLSDNIALFNREKMLRGLKPIFVYSKSAIQSAIISGNEKVKTIASELQQMGFDAKAILSPTVPEGQERLRICLHSYNSETEITALLESLSKLILY